MENWNIGQDPLVASSHTAIFTVCLRPCPYPIFRGVWSILVYSWTAGELLN